MMIVLSCHYHYVVGCVQHINLLYLKAMASVMEMYSRVRGAQGDNRFVNIITTTRYLDALDDF